MPLTSMFILVSFLVIESWLAAGMVGQLQV
jgi:hypothetical protein